MRADVARAMGVVRAGDAEDAAAIAKLLEACTDEAWAGVTALFLQANYPPRLFALVRCEACGARNDVDGALTSANSTQIKRTNQTNNLSHHWMNSTSARGRSGRKSSMIARVRSYSWWRAA